MRKQTILLSHNRTLDLGHRTLIMGIVNRTPDSFYSGSRSRERGAAVAAAMKMVEAGADIIDIGGESTRPGAPPVDAAEELNRVIPVIESIAERIARLRPGRMIAISIDTQKAMVAEQAIRAGAHLVNDVSALRADPDMAGVVVTTGAPVVLMHMRGTPATMQQYAVYRDPVTEVCAELGERVAAVRSAGVRDEQIIVDPGIGFAKLAEHNLAILRGIDRISSLGFPVLVGASRKSFIGKLVSRDDAAAPPEERLSGSLAVVAYCAMRGVDIVRVHDVRETAEVASVIQAILGVDDVIGGAAAERGR